jgi:hypothetical protein
VSLDPVFIGLIAAWDRQPARLVNHDAHHQIGLLGVKILDQNPTVAEFCIYASLKVNANRRINYTRCRQPTPAILFEPISQG